MENSFYGLSKVSRLRPCGPPIEQPPRSALLFPWDAVILKLWTTLRDFCRCAGSTSAGFGTLRSKTAGRDGTLPAFIQEVRQGDKGYNPFVVNHG